MRTQTTSVLAQYSKDKSLPLNFVCPGLVFRAEKIDATHDINFHQLEMWSFGDSRSLSDIFTMIKKVFQEFFDDPNLQIRLRPSFFPFTAPSFEGDIYCPWIKGGQWVEVFGGGLADNKVIENLGFDPKVVQGIGFGIGLTRLAQLKLGVNGISQFYNGGLDFLM
jgi:phenylalanyl-tRNA synthetase alpha chain